MTLDQRAKQAADGLKNSVSGHPLLMMSPAPAKPALLPRIMSFAGAFVVVIVAGFLMMQTNMFASDETADTMPPTSTTPITSTTLPDTPPSTATITPIVPSEGGGGSPTEPAEPTPEVVPDTSAPELVVTSPLDGDRLKETAVAFQGRTEPGAVVMAGPYEAAVAEDGTWSIVLILGEGGNRATITATDAAGNVAEASLVVYYDPPATTTTTKPPSEWSFTSQAKYGECALDPPYDEYYGTAAPGTKILITSEFGSGSTVANASGEWWAKVEFPTAPYGKVFSVRVKNETTYEKYFFEFVSLVE